MILDVYMHGRRHQPDTWQETELLVTVLVENVPEPEPHPDAKLVTGHLAEAISQVLKDLPQATWPYGGQIAEFTFTGRPEGSTGGLLDFDSYLHVAVNARTGHGALKWMLTRGSTVEMDPSIADQVWLSDNPAPPSKDPQRHRRPRVSPLPPPAQRSTRRPHPRGRGGVLPRRHRPPADVHRLDARPDVWPASR
ncbi:hypothetical protein [Streptomyces sp. M41(2017)]|uniref:hypothetical protein n=1 Tax=Streptomyces sp. M41(2017) TaxID=1955065 RepID=UPI001F4EDFC0|nr:hypothetical protein [Streptomyces sp. M41(2017)]